MTRSAVFLYDADCGFCARSAEVLDRISARGRYDIEAWQRVDLTALGLTAAQCGQESWFVTPDGATHGGGAAISRALRAGSPPLRPVGAVLELPGVRRVSRWVYRWVARNRHRLPGSTDQCRVA